MKKHAPHIVAALLVAVLFVAPLLCSGCHSTLDTKVPVGELSLHIVCSGDGAPTVVFESGLGNDARAWQKVQPHVAEFTRVCAYDRAGRGLSSPVSYPHGNARMADELYDLLIAAEVPGPYVLVGHSMGGTNVRLFAAKHPESVAGLVLVDAAPLMPPVGEFPPDEQVEFENNLRQMEGLDLSLMSAGIEAMRSASQSIGDKPLVVLIAGKPELEPLLDAGRARELFAERQAAQGELGKLSTNSVVRTVAESAHHIPIEAPGAVVTAVDAVVEAVRSGAKLKGP